MIIYIILLIVGFVLLIKGADIFVDGASSVAENCHLSKMLIGLTIVAFGTSAPEFAVSVKSILSGNGDIVFGNVIGSNIFNILLILGISGLISTMRVKSETVKKEIPLTLLITLLFAILISDNLFTNNTNVITRSDGVVILLFFMVFIYYLFSIMRNKKENEDEKPKYSLFKSFIYTIIGIVAIVFGSNMVVDYATLIAKILNVSEKMISLTIIAFGTSLPELVTSIVAAKKNENDIAIGNIIGSNIFNIGIVIGIPVAIFGSVSAANFNYIDLIVMILAVILLFVLTYKKRKIEKREGLIMIMIFIIYYSYVILGGI